MFHGNTSIYWFDMPAPVNGTSEHGQAPMYLWDGFLNYSYTYNGTFKGPRHEKFENPAVFHKLHALNFKLDTSQYIYDWEYNLDLLFPLKDSFSGNTRPNKKELSFRLRRFEESAYTWQGFKNLGTTLDSFGMPYKIPVAMSSLERLTGLPMFAGTPHAYGNLQWGGSEYDHVQGYVPNQPTLRSYVDYDPITGKFLRQVVRQSVSCLFYARFVEYAFLFLELTDLHV